MHQQNALGDRLPADAATRQNSLLADRLRSLALKGELRRVVQYKGQTFRSRHARLSRSKMSGEDDAFIDARAVEESLRRLGRGPILARGGKRRTDLLAQPAVRVFCRTASSNASRQIRITPSLVLPNRPWLRPSTQRDVSKQQLLAATSIAGTLEAAFRLR
jgi:hypothetical protein